MFLAKPRRVFTGQHCGQRRRIRQTADL